MNAIKMSDEVWYFEDAVENPEEILESIDDWRPNPNQDYMVTSQIATRDYLEMTDDAIFKCLDIWYRNHLNLDSSKHKVAKSTFLYKRGPGLGYGPHTDFIGLHDGTYEQVTATILAYLCDEDGFEGGEIFFPDYDVTIKPKKGSVVIFGRKVRHGVNDVISGERAIASVFLVKDQYFYKDMYAFDPKNPTEEERRTARLQVPQYEQKNANEDVSKFVDDED
jgi:hypothetical protein